jgi:hypothetical protein
MLFQGLETKQQEEDVFLFIGCCIRQAPTASKGHQDSSINTVELSAHSISSYLSFQITLLPPKLFRFQGSQHRD